MKSTIKCELCDSGQRTKWCESKCIHGKTLEPVIKSIPIKPLRAPAARGKNKPSKVLCVDTNIEYETIDEAAKAHGVTRDSLMNCARGDTRTCKGLVFQYVGKSRKTPPTAKTAEELKSRYVTREVKYIPTGRVYKCAVEAAHDTGYGLSTVYTHAPRPPKAGQQKLFQYMEGTK